jgi:hypothetical protein
MPSMCELTESIKRFVLTSIDSVPHLEAILLLHYDPEKEWNSFMMSQTLYISEKRAHEILDDLCANQLAAKQEHAQFYRYEPLSTDLKEKIDQLADIYAKHLIEVTNLLHSKTHKQARQFGDAFKWPEEKDQ